MLMSIKILEREFTAESSNQAFKKAASWIANKIIKNKDFNNITWNMSVTSPGVCTLILYGGLDTVKDEKSFCEICKSFHSSFYINEEYYCPSCNHKAFINRMNEKLKVKKSYCKEQIIKGENNK